MVIMFHDVDDLIFSAEEDKKYHSTKWYFLITVMRPVTSHRRFQALKTQRTVNGSNQLGAARFEFSRHGVRLVWRNVQNLAYIRV